MVRFLTLIILTGCILFTFGCSKKTEATGPGQETIPPMMQQSQGPMAGMPNVKKDHFGITEVTGQIQEVSDTGLVVFTTKNVSLKFGVTKGTEVRPKGKKLLPGMKVKIHIEQTGQGMNAKAVEILK